jgi:hypothetical protein
LSIRRTIFSLLNEIRERFADPNDPLQIDPKRKKLAKTAICSRLQQIAQTMLEGTFR